jgi:hypothetical protein
VYTYTHDEEFLRRMWGYPTGPHRVPVGSLRMVPVHQVGKDGRGADRLLLG